MSLMKELVFLTMVATEEGKRQFFTYHFKLLLWGKWYQENCPSENCPQENYPPPRKLTPRKSSPTKISSYEYSPLWMLPLWKLPPRNLPAWENYPHEFPSPFRNHTNERKTKITKTFASKKAVQHKSLR